MTAFRSAASMLLFSFVLGTCDGAPASAIATTPTLPTASSDPSPAASPIASAAGPSLTPVPGAASPSPSPTDPPTTATEWGTIWDALPAWYPVPHTATPAIVRDPATAAFSIPAAPEGTAAAMQASLEGAGYSTLAMSGPLEDGSMIIDSAGDGQCRLQTILQPAGDTTLMTVLVGAECSFR